MHSNWHPVGCFFWPWENGQEFSLMSGERSFLNLFRDSRTPLDSIRDKLVTLIYFVIVQCPNVRTTWYSASCAKKGYTWAARDLRLPRRASGSALSACLWQMTGVRIVSCRSADFNMFQMTYKYNSVSSEDFGSLKFPWKKVQHSESGWYAHDLRYMVVVTSSSPPWRLINFFLKVDYQRRDFSSGYCS